MIVLKVKLLGIGLKLKSVIHFSQLLSKDSGMVELVFPAGYRCNQLIPGLFEFILFEDFISNEGRLLE
jgi:hypothetical protein